MNEQITDQSDGMREGAAEDVANLSELNPQGVGVHDVHFHRLVLPAPFLMRNAHCRVQSQRTNDEGKDKLVEVAQKQL